MDYMKALQAGQGRTQTPPCFVLSSPGVGLSNDWIVQWVSLKELAAVTPRQERGRSHPVLPPDIIC